MNLKNKILVIDDEKSIRVTFKEFFTDAGYEVFLADCYEEAIKILSYSEVNLVFADILLGSHTGIDVLREIKKQKLLCPVIMITGEPNIETAAEAVRLGAFDYVPKPVEQNLLYRIAEQAFRHNELVREKERYRSNLEAIFRSVRDGIVTVDPEMNITDANSSIETFFLTKPREILNLPFSKITTDSQEVCCAMLEETLKKRKTLDERTVEWKRRNGSTQSVTLNTTPLIDQQNNFSGAVLVMRDITRLSQLEQSLQERQEFQKIIGKSRKMQEIYTLLEALAETETTVLITGETGTGKELAADALHTVSNRNNHPLIKVNCSALSENLLESELFGHIKGAFTGAIKDKIGRFQMADKGTIFLDEIGDISPAVQVKLLRVLQEKEVERVGEGKQIKIDVRIIAATNRDLANMVREGTFREDLYYRLKVVEVSLPPLRDRPEDIPLLADYFCRIFSNKFKKPIHQLSDDVLSLFMSYSWPGNIRELSHALERAFVLCSGTALLTEHLPVDLYSQDIPLEKENISGASEKEKIVNALQKSGGNKAKAARLLGVGRQTIYRKIDEYNIIES